MGNFKFNRFSEKGILCTSKFTVKNISHVKLSFTRNWAETMTENDPTGIARIRKVNHGGDNHVRYCFPVFDCLTSSRCSTIYRTLSIVLLPGLILFGGITIFITGCLMYIPPMIIGGAAMFVLGILFCLLCGHACDDLTKRVRKRRYNRGGTKPVLVWFHWNSGIIFVIVAWQFMASFKRRVLQTQANQPMELYRVSGSSVACSRAEFSCSVLQWYVATDSYTAQVTLRHKSFK